MAAAYDSIPNLETLYCALVPLVFVKGSVIVGITSIDVAEMPDVRLGGGRVGGGCLADVDFEREAERVLADDGPVSSVELELVAVVAAVAEALTELGDGSEVGVTPVVAVISCRRCNCLLVNGGAFLKLS